MKNIKKIGIAVLVLALFDISGLYAMGSLKKPNLRGQTQHQNLIGRGGHGQQQLIGGKGGRQHLLGTEGRGQQHPVRRFGENGSGQQQLIGGKGGRPPVEHQGSSSSLYPQDVKVNTANEQLGAKRYKPFPDMKKQ